MSLPSPNPSRRRARADLTPIAIIVASAFVLSCYESETPLSPPGEVGRDPKLLGTWHCVPDEPDDPESEDASEHATLRVTPVDDSQYVAEWHEDDEVLRYRAHGSKVEGGVLLNVRELDSGTDAGGWVFLRYGFDSDGRLRLGVVRNDSVQGDAEAEQLDFIRKHASESSLYEPFAVCSKQE